MGTKELEFIFSEHSISTKGQEIFKRLYAINNKLLDTINFDILSDKFILKLSFEELSRIACDKKIQDILINLDDNKCDLLFKLKESFLTNDNWITGMNMIVKALNNPNFSQISESVLKSNNYELLKNYFNLINQDQNYFEIENLEQLKNYEEIKNNICNAILDNPENVDGLSEYIKKLSTLDRIKFATIEKNYGISLSQAKLLCQKYGFNIESAQETVGNKKIHTLLKDLTQIITAENLEQIEGLELTATNIENFNYIDTETRDSFAQMYNDALYKPNEKDIVEEIEIDGKKVPIYNAGTNFYMCTHVVGAFSSGNRDNESYVESWNRPTRANHVFCTRMVSNESLELANENSICYGFVNFENSALIASAPWDMASIQLNKRFDTVGTMDAERNMSACEGSSSRFFTPIEQANNTRTDGNETNWDRFSSNGERKQPSYVIYIADSMENGDYKNSPNYQNSLMVASQHGIPLVIIDRESVIANEHLEIENMLQEYERTQNPVLINRIIQKFENNRTTGYHQKCEEKYQTEFPLKDNNNYLSLESLVNKIVTISRNSDDSTAIYQQIIDELLIQAIRSTKDEKDFCDIVYQIANLDSSLTVDIDKILKMHLGITQKDKKPQLCSKNYLKSFYYKREGIIEPKDEKKKFDESTVETELQELSSETLISGFNDMSQNLKATKKMLAEQEQTKGDDVWGEAIDDDVWGDVGGGTEVDDDEWR